MCTARAYLVSFCIWAPPGTVGDIEPLNPHDYDFENRGRLVCAELGDIRLHLLSAFSPPKASLVQAHLGSVRVPARTSIGSRANRVRTSPPLIS